MKTAGRDRGGGDPSVSPRLFESDLLERLSRVHHLTPLFVYGPVILVMGGYSLAQFGAIGALAWSSVGLLGWTLTEYLGHRYVFHRVPKLPFGLGPRLHFVVHGVHHVYPNDPYRLVMPPLLSAPIMLAATAVIWLIFGSEHVWPASTGFVAGYLAYDMLHYRLHHGPVKSRIGRYARRLHMRHHFHDATRNFGVMSIWWDRAFGTASGTHRRARD